MRQSARIWVFLGVFGVLATIAFGLVTADILQMASGTVMLGVFGISMLYIAWVLAHGRHTDPTDLPDAVAEVGPEHIFPPSWAPPLLALGVAMFACGIKFTPVLLAVGGTIIVLTLFTWIVQRVDVIKLQHAAHGQHATPAASGAHAAAADPVAHEVGGPELGHDNG